MGTKIVSFIDPLLLDGQLLDFRMQQRILPFEIVDSFIKSILLIGLLTDELGLGISDHSCINGVHLFILLLSFVQKVRNLICDLFLFGILSESKFSLLVV